MSPLLSIQHLQVDYRSRHRGRQRSVRVIKDLNLEVFNSETVAVVGESGAGKSTLAEAIVGLVRPAAGSIRFNGRELIGLQGQHRREVRRKVQMVAQNPLLSLSPRRLIAAQIEEPLKVHTSLSRAERNHRGDQMLAALVHARVSDIAVLGSGHDCACGSGGV